MGRILNSEYLISSQKSFSKNSGFSMNEFIVNEFITLRLEDNKTIIYVNNERFNQCKFLLLDIPIDEMTSLEDIESIDDVAEKLDRSLEFKKDRKITIQPEIEFWGHCSNLQVWYENDYNTKLIHRSLAFSLLKKLTEVGDKLAKKIFKEEIAIRFEEGNEIVKEYLRKEGFLEYLDNEQFCSLICGIKFNSLKELLRIIDTYSIIDRMSPVEFLGFVDSLDHEKLKKLVIHSKDSNLMNFIDLLIENLKNFDIYRYKDSINIRVLTKIGEGEIIYLMGVIIDKNGYINLPVLEALIYIDSSRINIFLQNNRHKFKLVNDNDLWDFQYILNVLLRCFTPEELVNFLKKKYKDDIFEIILPKMRGFDFLKMADQIEVDMKQFLTAFLLEEAGAEEYLENLEKLGDFLADTFLSELIDRNGELHEKIIKILDWIGGEAAGKLYKKLNELSDRYNIEKYKNWFY